MKALIFSLLIVFLFCYKTPAENTRQATPSFEGTYLVGKKDKYWVELTVTKSGPQNSFKIEVKSKLVKGSICCEFNKEGILKNDTIFVETREWKRPVTMIITKNKS